MLFKIPKRTLSCAAFAVYVLALVQWREAFIYPLVDHAAVLLEGRTLKGIPAHQLESFLRLSEKDQAALEDRPLAANDSSWRFDTERARLRRQRAVFAQERWWLALEGEPTRALIQLLPTLLGVSLGLGLLHGCLRKRPQEIYSASSLLEPHSSPPLPSRPAPRDGEVLEMPTEDEIRHILTPEPPEQTEAPSQKSISRRGRNG